MLSGSEVNGKYLRRSVIHDDAHYKQDGSMTGNITSLFVYSLRFRVYPPHQQRTTGTGSGSYCRVIGLFMCCCRTSQLTLLQQAV